MGMLDASTRFSIGQGVAAVGDTASTNIYDQGASFADLGLASRLWVNVTCAAPITPTAGATVQAVLQDSTDAAGWADLLRGAVLPASALQRGVELMTAKVPNGARRYLRLVYRVGTAPLSGAIFNAHVAADLQRSASMPSAFSVN